MKKTTILVTLLFFSIFACNAQLFIGGTINTNSSGGKTKVTPTAGAATSTDMTKNFSFTFAPRVGFFLSEKLAAGAALNFGQTKTTLTNGDITPQTMALGITPFVRYYIGNGEKLNFFVTAGLTIGQTTSKSTVAGVTTDNPSTNNKAFNIGPSVSYKATEKIHLEAGLNFLNLNYSSNTTKTEVVGFGTTKSTNNSFNFGLSSNGIFTTGALTVGAIFIL